jgi:hypothetical protein
MKTFSSFALIALAFSIASCKAPEAPNDASEAIYQAPDRIENQREVQELHGDILRQDF